LIESSRDPELDACRALVAIGITGRLAVWRSGAAHAASRVDIERGAKWSAVETDHGPRFVPWQPFDPWRRPPREHEPELAAIAA
jgi:hypothetical protein